MFYLRRIHASNLQNLSCANWNMLVVNRRLPGRDAARIGQHTLEVVLFKDNAPGIMVKASSPSGRYIHYLPCEETLCECRKCPLPTGRAGQNLANGPKPVHISVLKKLAGMMLRH